MATKKEKDFHVKVLSHKGKLYFIPTDHQPTSNFHPTGGNNMGCVTSDSKKFLQVSQEALDLMRKIKKNHDAIGDISWWRCADGTYAFSWFGAIFRIVDPDDAECDRDFAIPPAEFYTLIPNDVPKEVKKGIGSKFYWRKPFSLTVETI